jgi:hypothetical protein
LAVNFWSVTYFGVFNFGTSYLGAKIGQTKTMTKISRFTVLYKALFYSKFEILWKLKFLKLFLKFHHFEFFWNLMKFLKVEILWFFFFFNFIILNFFFNFEMLCWHFLWRLSIQMTSSSRKCAAIGWYFYWDPQVSLKIGEVCSMIVYQDLLRDMMKYGLAIYILIL